MILNSTKFGGNQTKDVEVGPDRQTGRFLYTLPNYVCGGIRPLSPKATLLMRPDFRCKQIVKYY
jgi:hypothetical protein